MNLLQRKDSKILLEQFSFLIRRVCEKSRFCDVDVSGEDFFKNDVIILTYKPL